MPRERLSPSALTDRARPVLSIGRANGRFREARPPQCDRLGWLVKQRGIIPFIPVIDKSERTDGTWSRSDFEWDEENDQYICPEGHALRQYRRNYSDPERARPPMAGANTVA